MPKLKKTHQEKVYLTFILAMLGLLIVSAGFIVYTGYGISSFLLFVDPDDTFMDFFNPIYHAFQRNPYIAVDRIYPAICYFIYFVISKFINIERISNISGRGFRANQDALSMFIFIAFLTILAFVIVFVKLLEKNNIKINGLAYAFMALIFLSAPFIYQWERANIIIWPLILLMFFILFKDSENKVLKELAIISLALAASIKIYPAIFGLMLLKDKKIKESIRCAIYGIILFVLPFRVMGGFDKLPVMINSITEGSDSTVLNFGLGYKVNFANTITLLSTFKYGEILMEVFRIGQKLAYVISAICFVGACLTKSEWKCYALLSIIMIGLPGFSFAYCMIFMLIPLIIFLGEIKSSVNKAVIMDYIYIILFVMCFGVFAVRDTWLLGSIPGIFPCKMTYFIESIAICLMGLILVVDITIGFIKNLKIRG